MNPNNIYDSALKAIEEYIAKCPATYNARKYGFERTITEWKDKNGTKYSKVTYGDGTGITYKTDKKGTGIPIEVELPDGRVLHSLDDESYTLFQHQKDIIISRYGEEAYDLFKEYSDMMDGHVYSIYKNYKYEWSKSIPEKRRMEMAQSILQSEPAGEGYDEKVAENQRQFQFFIDNEETYNKICADNDLRSYGDFFTWHTILPKDTHYELGKKIVTVKEPYDETVGQTFKNNMPVSGTTPQYVITIREQDNPANTGAFTGNALNEYRAENPEAIGTWDWNTNKRVKEDYLKRIHIPPGTKFENIVIDDAKPWKTVIRKPYVKSNI